MHRVPNTDHEISDLGQDLSPVNKEFPEVYELLASQGVKVGVFGPCIVIRCQMILQIMHTMFLTLLQRDRMFPNTLSAFQRFNYPW